MAADRAITIDTNGDAPDLTTWRVTSGDRHLTGLGVPSSIAVPAELCWDGDVALTLRVAAWDGSAWPLTLRYRASTLTLSSARASVADDEVQSPIGAAALVTWFTEPARLFGHILPGGVLLERSLYLLSFFDGLVGVTKGEGDPTLGASLCARIDSLGTPDPRRDA